MSLKIPGLINLMGIVGVSHEAAFLRKKNHVPSIRYPIQLITSESGLRNAISQYKLSTPMVGTPKGYWQ